MPRPLSPSPLWRVWLATAARHKGRPALIGAETGEALSFEALTLRALEMARADLAGAHRRVVAFCLRNSGDWLACFLACQAVGAAALPLDPDLPPAARAAAAQRLGAHFFWQEDKLQKIGRGPALSASVAFVKVSSGSSGEPAPIHCRASHLLADGENILATMKIRPRDRNLGLIPFGHSYGLGNLVMPLLLQGTPIVAAEEFVLSQIPRWIAQHAITVYPTVPSVLRALAELPGSTKLKPLRLVVSAGAVLSPETARAFHRRFAVRVHNLYGSSETGSIAYDRTGAATLSGRAVGTPLQGVAVGRHRSGRVWVKSRAVVHPGGRFLLPDFGEISARGQLRLLGRALAAANIGGRKVHPAEVEGILRQVPGVTDAWVGVARGPSRDYLIAGLEGAPAPHAVDRFLQERLPAWKIPRVLRALRVLPRTARGKIDAPALRTLLLA